MTEEQIQEIKRSLEDATEGRWVSDGFGSITIEYSGRIIAAVYDSDDADLIANAPTWIAQLLAERETLQQQNKQLTETMQRIMRICRDDKEAKRPDPMCINLINGIATDAIKQIQGNT